MSGFVGTWQHSRSENLEAFFKALGLNMVARKMASKSNPKMTIENEGKEWKLKLQINPVITTNTVCTEDEEFVDKPPIGKECKAILHMENNSKMVITSREVGNESKVVVNTRELIGDQLVMTFEINGVTAKRYFNRI